MAVVTFIVVLIALTAGCILSQSTTDDSDTSLQDTSLQLQIAKLEQQHFQMAQVLDRILDQQQQLQRLLTNCLAHCLIEVKAYSANNENTPRYGFVKLNADPVWQSWWNGTIPYLRGVNVILVDPFTCSVWELRHFDTYGDVEAATDLSNYLQQVSRGNIIVGVTADEPRHHLASALPTLREIGVDVADVQIRGSFGFVAQRGFPTKTVLRKVLTQAESNENPAQFNATVTGCSTDAFSITVV